MDESRTTPEPELLECTPDDPTDGGLSPAPAVVHPTFFRPPHGLADIKVFYGDIAIAGGKVVTPGWESRSMKVVSDLPGVPHKLYINARIEAPLREALRSCIDLRDAYVVRTIGCFNPRPKRTNGSPSVHAWGAAVDINADTNPMRAPLTKDLPDAWIQIFEAVGWTWGGRFPTPDPMHFQWASGY